jgi:hypothetical protein
MMSTLVAGSLVAVQGPFLQPNAASLAATISLASAGPGEVSFRRDSRLNDVRWPACCGRHGEAGERGRRHVTRKDFEKAAS